MGDGDAAAPGTEMELEMPGTTVQGMLEASVRACSSSMPRPKTYGSPPLRRTTDLPCLACSISALLMASWAMNRPYGIFAASITSTWGGSSASRSRGPSRSAMTTSASASRRRPRTVMRSGSPGPPPTRATPAVRVRWWGRRGCRRAVPRPRRRGWRRCAGVASARVGGEHRDGDALAVAGRRGPGGGLVGVVGADAPDAVVLRLGGGRRVRVGVAGGDQGVPGVGEVALGVRAAVPGELAGVRHGLHGGGGLGDTRWMSAPALIRAGRRRWATWPPPRTTIRRPVRRRPTG